MDITRQPNQDNVSLVATNFKSRNDCRLARELDKSPAYHVAASVPWAANFHTSERAFIVWIRGFASDYPRALNLVALDSAMSGCLVALNGASRCRISASAPFGTNSNIIRERITQRIR